MEDVSAGNDSVSEIESKDFSSSCSNSVNGDNDADKNVVGTSANSENEKPLEIENDSKFEASTNAEGSTTNDSNTEVNQNQSDDEEAESKAEEGTEKSREWVLETFGPRDLYADLEYLNKLKEPEAIVNDQEAFEIIAHIKYMIGYGKVSTNILEEVKALKLISDLFLYLLCADITEFKSITRLSIPAYKFISNSTLNERKLFGLLNVSFIINHHFMVSIGSRIYFQTAEILSAILGFIRQFGKEFGKVDDDFGLSGLLIFNLNWMSKEAENYKQIWHELNTVQTLLEFNEHNNKYIIYIYMIIVNISSDKDIEGDISETIKIACCKLLEMFVSDLTDEMTYEINDIDDKQKRFQVKSFYDKSNNALVSVIGILDSLYKLAVNECIKTLIYSYHGFKDKIEEFIYSCNDVEKHHALLVLAQLAFDKEICQGLCERKEFLDYVRKQKKREDFEFLKLKKSCKEFLWVVTPKEAPDANKSVKNVKEQHIMISYNSESRDLCLRVKDFLEKANHKVWLDIYSINGKLVSTIVQGHFDGHVSY